MQYCSPGFFKTLKIPVLLGRDFNERDLAGAGKVGIVNQQFVNRYLKGTNPLGRHAGMGIGPGTRTDLEIAGVVGDTKYENMRDKITFKLYIPAEQRGFAKGGTVYVRAARNPAHMFNAMHTEVRAVDASVPMWDMRTLSDQLEISLLTDRLLATLSSVFGCLATLLAGLGLYGVMAFMVTRRTREIGIGMALGAGQRAVAWVLLRGT